MYLPGPEVPAGLISSPEKVAGVVVVITKLKIIFMSGENRVLKKWSV